WRRPQRSCTDNLSEKLYRRGLEATGCVTYLPPEAWRTRLLVRRTIPTAAELNGDVRNLRVVRQVGVRCRRHPLGAPGPSVSPMRRGAKRGRRRAAAASSRLRRDAHRHRLEALHEVRVHPLRLADHLDLREAAQDLLPHDA